MKIRRTSINADRINSIVEMGSALVQSDERDKYSFTIEFAIAELVREEMRSCAQKEGGTISSGKLLGLAIERVTQKVEVALRTQRIKIDLGKYVTKVREKLKYPAQEIQSLGDKLTESRHVQKLVESHDLVSESGRRFIIHELGLREAIQGVLIEATEECQDMNVGLLREQGQWRIEGEWFPYEVFAEEFVFVIDDDGSIFVSTANLPTELRRKAIQLIVRMAGIVYSP